MAQQLVTMFVDDITGQEIPDGAGRTIEFAFDGVAYEIDLDVKNAQKFAEAMAFYIDHGRKVGRAGGAPATRRAARAGSGSGSDLDNTAIRAWAAQNGYRVSPRGRIRNDVIAAYRAANG